MDNTLTVITCRAHAAMCPTRSRMLRGLIEASMVELSSIGVQVHGRDKSVPASEVEPPAAVLGAGFATPHAASLAGRGGPAGRALGGRLRSPVLSVSRQPAGRRGRKPGL